MSGEHSETLTAIDKVLCLQNVDVFKYATTEMLAYIGSIAHEVAVVAGSVIFAEHEMSDAMYVVVEGGVRLEKEGKEVLLVGESQSFGTWALFDNAPQLMTAVVVEDSQLLKIKSEDFYEVLADHEDITPAIFKAVIERVRSLAPE